MRFIELPPFTKRWAELGLGDDERRMIDVALMCRPELGKVVAGTGGLRKARFGIGNRGKRSGVRLCYVYFRGHGVIVFVTVYPKNEKDDLEESEKKAVAKLIVELEALLSRERTRGREKGRKTEEN